MHSTRRMKTTKSVYRPKIRKKRHKSKSVGCTPRISVLDLQNINEVLRVHKTQRAEGKGAWKVVPKDSCEIYKNRRKRQAENENSRHKDEDTKIQTTDSDNTNSDDNKTQRRREDKKRRSSARKTKRRQKPKRRCDHSSLSSITTSTTSCKSCLSSSEMDYE